MSSLKIRIYFEDTDAQGVVYNSNYLKFLERGRTEFLREIGYDQKQLLDNDIIFTWNGVINQPGSRQSIAEEIIA